MIRLALFGTPKLTIHDVVLDLARRPRLLSLLAFLVLNRHASQSRADIVTALWPDSAAAPARNRLRNLLREWRKLDIQNVADR